MKWYFITGRIPFDDEDTGLIFHAPNEEVAVKEFKEEMLKRSWGSDWSNPDVRDMDDDEELYILYVMECDTKPRILTSP